MNRMRAQIECEGIVQGVGFRPFIHKLALELGLAGWVLNSSAGVAIQVEGPPETIRDYLARIERNAPPLARILALRWRELPPLGLSGFEIKPSLHAGDELTLLCPDVAICADCLAELLDPRDRRYRYPFINCTNCGPRYTIVRALPYDRPATTIAGFPLCPDCAREYADVQDRRYHAQPVACPACGPQVWCASEPSCRGFEAIQQVARLLDAGGIVAVKGLGGFHLTCRADSDEAVLLLRRRKQRSFFKPLAVMVHNLAAAQQLCALAPAEAAWLESHQRPILLAPKQPGVESTLLSPYVAPHLDRLGIMLPYTPLHVLLLIETTCPLVMTSANLSDEPLCADNAEAQRKLAGLADELLLHDRPIWMRCDDSVLACTPGGAPAMLRSGRGFAPFPVYLGQDGPDVLALGGDLKTTFAASRGRFAFLSPHLGDGEYIETYSYFRETWEHYRRLFGLKPQAIACDQHPRYHTGRWAAELARELNVPLVAVQHHHAHLAALLAEYNLPGPCTAITADGTGYGADGASWGGEVLHGDYQHYERVVHLPPIGLLGGDAAAREPWRIALALLLAAGSPALEQYASSFLNGTLARQLTSEFPARIPEEANPRHRPPERATLDLALALLRQDRQVTVSTALGRLFDGVAALLGITTTSTYEGQAPMELEAIARLAPPVELPARLHPEPAAPLDWRPVVSWLVESAAPIAEKALMFHHWAAQAFFAAACTNPHGLPGNRLLATGGCLQNTLLRGLLERLCHAAGVELVASQGLPAGDGGLALGVLAAARNQL